jgi:hypothetical protein
MPESRLNIHLCARRSGLDCIAFPNFIFANSHSRHGTPFISKRAACSLVSWIPDLHPRRNIGGVGPILVHGLRDSQFQACRRPRSTSQYSGYLVVLPSGNRRLY